jgi:hypothetical protein
MSAALTCTVMHGTVALLLVAVPTKLHAQDSLAHSRSTFWGFAALGIGGAADSAFYAAGVGAAWQRRKLILMGRIASVGPEEENRMSDAGLLVGIGTQGGRFHYLAAAGLAAARSSQDSTALALPVEAHATWRFSKWGGIGLRGFLSFNKLSTFGGLTVVAELGRLR